VEVFFLVIFVFKYNKIIFNFLKEFIFNIIILKHIKYQFKKNQFKKKNKKRNHNQNVVFC
jgi:hypothetical protein